MVKISVIVPCYNAEEYLKRCVNSIINQSLKEIEIILVDDGSIDKTPEICDYFADLDKRVLSIHQKNGGTSYARNKGLSLACGEYISFVDNDDFIHPQMLEILYKIGKSQDSDIVMGNALIEHKYPKEFPVIENKKINVEKLSKEKYISSMFSNSQIDWRCLAIWNKLYKKSMINNNEIKFLSFYIKMWEIIEEKYPEYSVYPILKSFKTILNIRFNSRNTNLQKEALNEIRKYENKILKAVWKNKKVSLLRKLELYILWYFKFLYAWYRKYMEKRQRKCTLKSV